MNLSNAKTLQLASAEMAYPLPYYPIDGLMGSSFSTSISQAIRPKLREMAIRATPKLSVHANRHGLTAMATFGLILVVSTQTIALS